MPSWSVDDKFSDSTSALLAMGAGAGGSMAVYAMYDERILRELGYGKVAMMGMVTEALSSYAYNTFVKPMA